jgi:hypothetical protein
VEQQARNSLLRDEDEDEVDEDEDEDERSGGRRRIRRR